MDQKFHLDPTDANIQNFLHMDNFYSLLLDFKSLPRKANAKTFMEISGQAHYENVASNILAFYFDTQEEHGLKDLFLKEFLKMAEHDVSEIVETTSVVREYPAEAGQRIDLVIQGDDFVIGIENKIYHWEANDFQNYGRVIKELGKEKSIIGDFQKLTIYCNPMNCGT